MYTLCVCGMWTSVVNGSKIAITIQLLRLLYFHNIHFTIKCFSKFVMLTDKRWNIALLYYVQKSNIFMHSMFTFYIFLTHHILIQSCLCFTLIYSGIFYSNSLHISWWIKILFAINFILRRSFFNTLLSNIYRGGRRGSFMNWVVLKILIFCVFLKSLMRAIPSLHDPLCYLIHYSTWSTI